MKKISTFVGVLALLCTQNVQAQELPKPQHWYDRITLRGYTQFRYSRLFESTERLKFETDKSVGENGGFLLRRGRLILQGDMADFLFIYLQPDFANTIGDTMHAPQLRDWYADVAVDKKKEFRFRAGQSKVPYGFENMQSSQNRIPIERSDAINTGVPGERDIGLMLYWAPDVIRKRFKRLVDSGLKGSGDYGVVGLGVYNGQSVNIKERNNNRHFVAHVTFPFKINEQYLEIGAHAYTGKVNVTRGDKVTGLDNHLDTRVAGTIVVYPQPLGFQAEYNVGKGPELFGKEVVSRPLHGGYVMVTYKKDYVTPYVRAAYYEGGRKNETNSPRNSIRELEAGVELQIQKWVELTAAFNISRREINYKPQDGRVVRLQLQFNY